MRLISTFNKGFRSLLCVINIFSKYAWVVPLKVKKGASIVDAFQKKLDKSVINLIKYWLTKGPNFTIGLLKNGSKIMILRCIQYIMKESLLLPKDLLEH